MSYYNCAILSANDDVVQFQIMDHDFVDIGGFVYYPKTKSFGGLRCTNRIDSYYIISNTINYLIKYIMM